MLLPSTATREVQRTAGALVHRFHLTEVLDLVSRDGLCKVLPNIGCPPKLQSMIESMHTDTKGTVLFNGSSSSYSKSAAASNKVASLLQSSLGCSLACC